MATPPEQALDQLQSDLKALGSTLGQLTQAASEAAGTAFAEAKEKATTAVKDIPDAARLAVASADKLVRDNPYPALGVAAAVGVVAGILMARK